jgi:hypothetical protein
MENNFIYEIPVILPARDMPHSQWGFNVQIDPYIAFSAREKIVPPDFVERFQKYGREIVKLYGVKGMNSQSPYSFIEKSALILGVSVPGDAADLSLDEGCREDFQEQGWKEIREIGKTQPIAPFSYTPHNVDTKDQAFCLLALWLNWANTVKYLDTL